jgi:hypothetical protein
MFIHKFDDAKMRKKNEKNKPVAIFFCLRGGNLLARLMEREVAAMHGCD